MGDGIGDGDADVGGGGAAGAAGPIASGGRPDAREHAASPRPMPPATTALMNVRRSKWQPFPPEESRSTVEPVPTLRSHTTCLTLCPLTLRDHEVHGRIHALGAHHSSRQSSSRRPPGGDRRRRRQWEDLLHRRPRRRDPRSAHDRRPRSGGCTGMSAVSASISTPYDPGNGPRSPWTTRIPPPRGSFPPTRSQPSDDANGEDLRRCAELLSSTPPGGPHGSRGPTAHHMGAQSP